MVVSVNRLLDRGRWDQSHYDEAMEEGWAVYVRRERGKAQYLIGVYHLPVSASRGLSDSKAVAMVHRKADEGDPLALRALAYIAFKSMSEE